MTKPLHNARTGSARPAEYHIVFRDGMYKIFDKAQRFRCSFATPAAANAYVASRTASRSNALDYASDQ